MNIVILGGKSNITQEILFEIADRKINAKNNIIVLSDIAVNKGRQISCGIGNVLTIGLVEDYEFLSDDIVILSESFASGKKYIGSIIASGARVIDCFSISKDYLFANSFIGDKYKKERNINTPSVNSIGLTTILSPLMNLDISRIVLSTYNSVASAGNDGFNELYNATKSTYENNSMDPEVFEKDIAFNVIPKVGEASINSMYEEEVAIVKQTPLILEQEDISISAFCARVPVFVGDAISLNIELGENTDLNKIKALYSNNSNVEILDNHSKNVFATHKDVKRSSKIHISRMRSDISMPNSFNMWIVFDGQIISAHNITNIIEGLLC